MVTEALVVRLVTVLLIDEVAVVRGALVVIEALVVRLVTVVCSVTTLLVVWEALVV